MTRYLQKLVEDFNQDLPADWFAIDFKQFSKDKTLFTYQQVALTNTLKALYLYFVQYQANKSDFYKHYQNNGLTDNLDYNLKQDSKIIKHLQQYDQAYPIKDGKLSFQHFINRMSFWMATGSGKTLVIVKLIELLGYLMLNQQIPRKDILFLTYRADLIDQFQKHLDEFNASRPTLSINLFDLKQYESNQHCPGLKFGQAIDVYYYRSDLISDEQKEKILNYKHFDNHGNWYILLDEAHKGDREDSKRQMFYSILSRNGFLFNFSATFTDERDLATCVYDFNLSKFIEEGYGKHIYISQASLQALEKRDTIPDLEKQKILLKIFVLQTALNKCFLEVRQISNNLYHKPLLLTLVNSVNTSDSDLELFFKEIEKIASGQSDTSTLESAKQEILEELSSKEANLEFEENANLLDERTKQVIETVSYADILSLVFNATTTGKIEVLKIPNNKQELVFKLATSDKPFALMKIGDITEWIKHKLSGYELVDKFDDESIFKNLNNNEDITILMGSRSFYEGWDSNRPNLILFINIGKGSEAKKFVLQSIGRGVRLEPLPKKRGRIHKLYNNQELDSRLFEKIQAYIQPLESLFVFGTKADNLKEVIAILKQEKPEVSLGDLFVINPAVKDKDLLIPVYRDSDKIIAEDKDIIKYPIHPDDYKMVKNYFNDIGEKIALVKYNCDLRVLNYIKQVFNGGRNTDEYFLKTNEQAKTNNPEFLLASICKHFASKAKEFQTFKKLEQEIIHFKRIHITATKLNSLREKLEKVKRFKDKDQIKQDLKTKLHNQEIDLNTYTSSIEAITKELPEEVEIVYDATNKLKIQHIANHYYLPVVLATADKADFIQHVIKHPSEVSFINDLNAYLQESDNFFSQLDWWFFSKIDETLDEVYIPYYNPKTNRIDKFKPDFIFWLKRGNQYTILFLDPKSTEYTDSFIKAESMKIFDQSKQSPATYAYNQYTVRVKLFLYNPKSSPGLPGYKQYVLQNLADLQSKLDFQPTRN